MTGKKILSLLICILLTLCFAGCGNDSSKADTENAEKAKGNYFAVITVENFGEIELILYGDKAPITVANFVNLAKEGFYDGLTFHRIIEGFMIQGGDPQGNGYGGSDKNIFGEFSSNGFENDIKHERGVISMARAKDPNSASSQFFIVHETNESSSALDGDYAAFGKVISGIEVVDKIAEQTPVTDYNGTVSKSNQPVIKSIVIKEKEN